VIGCTLHGCSRGRGNFATKKFQLPRPVQFSAATGIDYTVYRPRILGHEVAGTVVQVGEGVNSSMLGAEVAAGGSNVPGATPGMHIDGGFAEFCTVPAANLVRIAKGVDFGVAAVATDSVRTSTVRARAGMTTTL
jgi:alcohol dehydrogenase, propanol-preferring